MAAMQEKSREMIQSSEQLIIHTRMLAEQTNHLIAGSKKSIATLKKISQRCADDMSKIVIRPTKENESVLFLDHRDLAGFLCQ